MVTHIHIHDHASRRRRSWDAPRTSAEIKKDIEKNIANLRVALSKETNEKARKEIEYDIQQLKRQLGTYDAEEIARKMAGPAKDAGTSAQQSELASLRTKYRQMVEKEKSVSYNDRGRLTREMEEIQGKIAKLETIMAGGTGIHYR